MRQQTNQLLKNIDKDRLRTYLNISEKELSQLGYQEIYYKFNNMQEAIREDYYELVEEFGLSLYLRSLKDDDVIIDFKELIKNKKQLREFFEEECHNNNSELNTEYFTSWDEFYIRKNSSNPEIVFEEDMFIYVNEIEKRIQLVKPVLIEKYEDEFHHEHRSFIGYPTEIFEEFELERLNLFKGYKIYCYYLGLYQLSGEAEIFSINSGKYKMRNIYL